MFCTYDAQTLSYLTHCPLAKVQTSLTASFCLRRHSTPGSLSLCKQSLDDLCSNLGGVEEEEEAEAETVAGTISVTDTCLAIRGPFVVVSGAGVDLDLVAAGILLTLST